jgi:hypothetical protein
VVIPVIGTIATTAFGGADSYVTNLTLGGPSAGTDAFKGNRRLDNVTLLDPVAEVYAGAFQDCINLVKVVFPATSLTNINNNAFNGCTRLRNLTLPTYNTFLGIGNYAFKDCVDIESVTLLGVLQDTTAGSPRRIVAEGAFQNTGLKSVTIPGASGGTIIGIGDKAFAGCEKLERVVFPDNTSFAGIGANAFDGCSSLKTVTNNAAVAATAAGTSGGVEEGVVVIPPTVLIAVVTATPAGLGAEAFKGCTSIASLKLNMEAASVVADLGAVFKGCSRLETLTVVSAALLTGSLNAVPANPITAVKHLVLDVPGANVMNFTGLSELEELTVRAAIPTAASTWTTAFTAALNSKFKTLNLTKVGQGTTGGDTTFASLPTTVTRVIVYDEEPNVGTDPVGIALGSATGAGIFNSSVNYIEYKSAIGATYAQTFTGPTKLTVKINADPGTKLFAPATIETVILGPKVPLLNADATGGTAAFKNTGSLKEFIFDGYNDKMGSWNDDGVLYGRDNTPGSGTFGQLTTLIQYPIKKEAQSYGHGTSVPGSLNTIKVEALPDNTNLKYLTIPSSITSIENVDFGAMSAIDTVTYNAVQATVDASATAFRATMADVITAGVVSRNCVTIGDGVRYVPLLFAGITPNLTEITIPSSVVVIDDAGAFTGCLGLKVVNFNAVNLTSTSAFSGVTAIETIRIGPNVTAIPASTFAGTGVRVIRLPGIITIGNSAFNACNSLSSVTIGNRCESIGTGAFIQTSTAPDFVLTTVEIESNGIIQINGAFNAKALTGQELADLYRQNKAGVYSWDPDATNYGWKYVKF